MSPCVPCLLRNSYISFNSRVAPTKLVPWSLKIKLGLPRRAVNHLRAAMKASVVRSETGSKWTALTERETNKQIYAYMITGFLT